MSADRGWNDAGALSEVLLTNGCPCNAVQVSEWLEGHSEPSFDKKRAILSALQKALPKIDVWEAYRHAMAGGAPGVRDGSPPAEARSLESLTNSSPRLPPGLSQ